MTESETAKPEAKALKNLFDPKKGHEIAIAAATPPTEIEQFDPFLVQWVENQKVDLASLDPNNLDMATIVRALAQERAHISLTGYQDIRHIEYAGAEERIGDVMFGRVFGLVTHARSASLSLLMLDQSIIKQGTGLDEADLGWTDPIYGGFKSVAFADDYRNLREGFGSLRITSGSPELLKSLGLERPQKTEISVRRAIQPYDHLRFESVDHIVNKIVDTRIRYESMFYRLAATLTLEMMIDEERKVPRDVHKPNWRDSSKDYGVDQDVTSLEFRVLPRSLVGAQFPLVGMNNEREELEQYDKSTVKDLLRTLRNVRSEYGWEVIADIYRYSMLRSDLTYSLAAKKVREARIPEESYEGTFRKGEKRDIQMLFGKSGRRDMRVMPRRVGIQDYVELRDAMAGYNPKGRPQTWWQQRLIGKLGEMNAVSQARIITRNVKVHPLEGLRPVASAQNLYMPRR